VFAGDATRDAFENRLYGRSILVVHTVQIERLVRERLGVERLEDIYPADHVGQLPDGFAEPNVGTDRASQGCVGRSRGIEGNAERERT
jgi:hypothetical protein